MAVLTTTQDPGDPTLGLAPTTTLTVTASHLLEEITRTDANGTVTLPVPLPSSILLAGTTSRRNLIPNPSFEVDLGHMTGSNITTTRVTNTVALASGTQCARHVADAGNSVFTYAGQVTDTAYTLTPGKWFAFSAAVRRYTGQCWLRLRIIFRDAANANIGIATSSPMFQPGYTAEGAMARYLVSAQVPAGAVKALCLIYIYSDSAATVAPTAGDGFYTDAWAADEHTDKTTAELSVLNYFDGSTPSYEHVNTFNGIQHSSMSLAQDVLPFTYQDAFMAAGPATYQVRTRTVYELAASAVVSTTVDKPWILLGHIPGTGATAERVTAYQASRASQSTVHPIIGRTWPVVTTGVMGAPTGSLDLYAGTFRQLLDLEYYLAEGLPVMLRQPVDGFDMHLVALGLHRSPYQVEGQHTTRWRLTVDYAQIETPGA